MAGYGSPSCAAWRASFTAGNASSSRGSNVHSDAWEKSSAGCAPGMRCGQFSACEIGSFIEGGDACAMVAPSANVTIECTMDCGWTVTSILSGSTSNNKDASMSSRPLFTIVAEFNEFIIPIAHVGWATACS